MTAVNRNENRSYDITGLCTSLPQGKYSDELGGILKGQSINVNSKGEVNGLRLEGGECCVLSSKQVATRFYVNNANTQYGSSVYIVGNVEELGNWDVNKAVGPFFNNRKSIANYPTWFYDISLPSGKKIEYKYIMKDSSGNVIWESGANHKYSTVTQGTGVVVDNWK